VAATEGELAGQRERFEMLVSASTYPWDVARLGVDAVVDDLVEHGIEGIDLAATYHPIDAFSPRDGAFYSSPRGAVHFPARTERYGRIVPTRSADDVCAAWPAVAERAAAAGLGLSAWTVTLFQPWITDAHPDCARVLADGTALSTGVCPANGDFRDYLATLCLDVVDQFGVDLVRLESVMPLGYNVDWLRPRVLVDVPGVARDLLTLCFCPTCVRRGTGEGIDVERLRTLVRGAIAAEIGEGPGASGDHFAADPELQAFLSQHEQASIDLCRAVADVLAATPATIASTIRTPFPTLRRGVAGPLTEQLAEVVDQLAVSPAGGAGNRRTAAIAAAASHPVSLGMLVTRGLQFPGVSAAPDPTGADPLPAQLAEAVALGVHEVGLYNYGLLRDDDVRFFMDAVRAARPSHERPI
jgi:hypothetical protein